MRSMNLRSALRHLPRRVALAFGIAAVVLLALVASCRQGRVDLGPALEPELGRYATPRPDTPDTVTVVSYNIQYGEDLALALADLRATRRLREADVYLLQEMHGDGTDSLARALGCDYVYHRASVSPHHERGFGNAVLSRWPLRDHDVLVLPRAERLTGQRRIAVIAEAQLGTRALPVVSVHTAALVSLQEDRLEQAAAAAAVPGRRSGPLVIGGDFNTASRYEANLLRRQFRHLGLTEARLPEGHTMTRSVLGLVDVRFRLDHIYYRDLELVDTGIAAHAEASDHLPIWARFVLP